MTRGTPLFRRLARLLAHGILAGGLLLGPAGCGFGDIALPSSPSAAPLGPTTRQAPRIAMGANGKATCVWKGDLDVHAERWLPGVGWTDPVPIDQGAAEVNEPQVAMEPNGDAYAVWEQGGSIVGNHFHVGQGWTGAVAVSDGQAPAERPQLGVADDRTGFVVWQEGGRVRGSRLDGASGFGAPLDLGPAFPGAAPAVSDVTVAVGAGGDAVVAWSVGDEVEARTFEAGSASWSEVVVLGAGARPDVAITGDGRAVLAWARQGDVLAVRHDPAAGWAPVEIVEPGLPPASPGASPAPQVAVAGAGAALIVWRRDDEVRASGGKPDEAWAPPQPVAAALAAAGVPQVVLLDSGEALAVFGDRSEAVHAVFRDPVSGEWRPPQLAGPGQSPSLAVDAEGKAIAVWHYQNAIYAFHADLKGSW